MGKAKNGIFGAINGKVGNLVFYKLNGEDLVRRLGDRTGKLSIAQLANCEKMSLIVLLFSKIKPFLKVGFGIEAIGTNKNYHNIATSYNKANAFELHDGTLTLNYENVRLSQGNALAPRDPAVEVVNEGLRFNWAYAEDQDWDARMDQVMMMAYLPDDNDATYITSGARRSAGSDVLQIHPTLRNKRMEVFMSFVTDDRQSVATSIYLGRFN
jgi:hypothetical protein